MDFYSKIKIKVSQLQKKSLYREVKIFEGIGDSQFSRVLKAKGEKDREKDGKEDGRDRRVVCFGSNDYLGLSSDSVVLENSLSEIRERGLFSSGASPVVSGTHDCHVRLSEALARWKKREAALLFGSGYLANIALLSCLPGKQDLILSDERNHASIWDGMRLSKAEVVQYPHNDMEWLEGYLLKNRDRYEQVFIVTDAVFSMDGDVVRLGEIYRLGEKFHSILILDEAHSTGTLGENGSGVESHFGLENQDVILMGTLGKALGSYGAFVLGREELIEYLIQRARPWIYTTALPIALCICAFHALVRIKEDGTLLMELRENMQFFRDCIQKSNLASCVADSGQDFDRRASSISLNSIDTPIYAWVLGSAKKTMEISENLLDQGYFVPGIRPPTVRYGESRLRISLSRIHSRDSIEGLIQALSGMLGSK